MPARFSGRVVIVTGASSGIGRETALAFAGAGARVVLAARHASSLQEIVNAHPGWRDRLLVVPTDVTKDEDVQRLVATTVSTFGRIDILVNNAGIGMRATLADSPLDNVREIMDVNLYGPIRCIQAVLPQMRQQRSGQIVNVGSVLSMVIAPYNAVYCASKFALLALGDTLRIELHGTGIEVLSVLPSYTDTPFFEHMYHYGDGPVHQSPFAGQHPSRVARAILRGCARHKRLVVLTISARLAVWLRRLSPSLVDFAVRLSAQRAPKADSKTR
ncbi:MAG TPA: SDR family oxidoreductase [Verrucomicrobiae bacterium]|nr:SDR family oxidoreductase [Verrucomicrobiae bacterium]